MYGITYQLIVYMLVVDKYLVKAGYTSDGNQL